MKPLLTFVHCSDTHIGPTVDFEYGGYRTLRSLEAFIALVNNFPHPPDFVVHTGDISHDKSQESYVIAAEAFARLQVPIYYVNGNHDNPAFVRKYLGAPAHPGGDPDAPLDYVFTHNGERFLVLDAHSPLVPDPLGHLSEPQLDFVRAEAQPDGPPLTVLLHYPLFPMASPWLDEHMIVNNGLALHRALLPARERLRGVFFGHLHRGSQISREDITYTSVPSTAWQYVWRSWDDRPQLDENTLPAYHIVQYFPDHIIVQQYGLGAAGHVRK